MKLFITVFAILSCLINLSLAQDGGSSERYQSPSKLKRKFDYITTNFKFFGGDHELNNFGFFRIDRTFRAGKNGKILIDTRTDFTKDLIDSSHASIGLGTPIIDSKNLLVGVVLKVGSDFMAKEVNNAEQGVGGYSYGTKIVIAAFDDKFQAALERSNTFKDNYIIYRAFAEYRPTRDWTVQTESTTIKGNGIPFQTGVYEISFMRNFFYAKFWD